MQKEASGPLWALASHSDVPLRLVPVVPVVIPIAVVVSAPLPSLLHLGSIFVGLAAMIAMMLDVKIEFRPRIS
jgi:hypothetical protein